MKIMVIDGQGGGIGKNFVERLKKVLPDCELLVAGTNAMATAAMLKAGAQLGVTGENAIVYNCPSASVIVGPIGIITANAMMGELTPAIAQAVAESSAPKILIPLSKCHLQVMGVTQKPVSKYIDEAVETVLQLTGQETR